MGRKIIEGYKEVKDVCQIKEGYMTDRINEKKPSLTYNKSERDRRRIHYSRPKD